MTSAQGDTYRCYSSHSSSSYLLSLPSEPLLSLPSEPLELLVSGVHREPALLAQPGTLVLPGHSLTLQCHMEASFDRFVLTKEEGLTHPQRLNGQLSPNFPLNHKNHTHGDCPTNSSECSDPLELMVTGSYSKPNLSALPSPVVISGGNVTLHLALRERFGRFILTEEGDHRFFWALDSQHASGQSQALFPVGPVTPSHRWTFRCYGCYRNRPLVCSHPSDSLELLVSEWLSDRPSLSVHPGPRVASGENVTLLCQSQNQRDTFLLSKEKTADPPLRLRSEHGARQYQAEFSMSPVTSAHGDTYRCYSSDSSSPFLLSHPSEPLELLVTGQYQCAYYTAEDILSERSDPLLLVVTGEYSAPSLSAQPGSVVASGGNVSLSCSSKITSGPFHLLKEGEADPRGSMKSEWREHAGRWQAIFPLGPVKPSHGGTYRCYGSQSSNPNVWSQPSDPLHIEVTGVHKEPALTAQPSTLVLSGHSLTLQCHAEASFDRFALTKDEGITHPWRLDGQRSPDFPLGHVNCTHGGRYRCYSGHHLSSAWSAPSAPLDILVADLDWNLIILIRVSVALVLLLSLLLFLFLLFWCQSKGKTLVE
uniref:Ig-like domain-containing protein n=1 Tax=Pipistrellus kuhlii TaxID=59472 RepID=A0A7J8A742_PIPKU|nr:hypothetical protein mPipKuh1_007565 [Pipistrellus kuhlii]